MNLSNIKLFITDIDGVWTDGGMYYDNKENELKKFNTRDSTGVVFLKLLKIPIAIISSEQTDIVSRRAKKLGIVDCFLGIQNKFDTCLTLCQKYNLKVDNVAFIGDEINDLELIQNVGLSACPSDAADYVKNKVNWVMNKKGGEGVFSEFVIKYLELTNQYDRVIKMGMEYYKNAK